MLIVIITRDTLNATNPHSVHAVQCICGPNNRHIIKLGLLIQCGKDVLMVDKQES